MLIDTNDPKLIEQYNVLKEQLISEKLEKGVYSSSDIALVRVANELPINRNIKSISNVPFVCKLNDLPYEVMYSEFDKTIPDVTDYEEQFKRSQEISRKAHEFSPLSTSYRSSIHFTLNGLVSSHLQGNFEGRKFVIIDPFKYHENDDNILAVRAEDTYFKDNIKLSHEAIILVNEKDSNLLNDEIKNNYNVIYFKGDQKKAVECVLLNLKIVPEIIGKDYAIRSETSDLLIDFIKQKKYPQDKHCYSQSYLEDDAKNLILWEKYAESFYTFLYTKVYGDITNYTQTIAKLSKSSSYNKQALEILRNLILSIGIENYKKIVDEYNFSIMDKIAKNEYPTNNEILNESYIIENAKGAK